MNAIDLLKQDHRVVDGLFKQVEDTPPSRHPALFTRIKGELDTHAHIEETVFYPHLKERGNKELVDIILEGIEEHSQIKKFLKELAGLSGKNEAFEAKLKVLIEDTRHHVKEEEHEMFPMTDDQFTDSALEKLGTLMEVAKVKYQKAHGITPVQPPKGTLETILDKTIEMISDVFAGSPPSKPAGKTTAKPGSSRASTGKRSVEAKSRQKPAPAKANSASATAISRKTSVNAAKAKAAEAKKNKTSGAPERARSAKG